MYKQKVYCVIGICEDSEDRNSYILFSNYGVHSTRYGAIDELNRIVDECREEAESGSICMPEIEWGENKESLTLTFDDISIEHYSIYEREMDFQPDTFIRCSISINN